MTESMPWISADVDDPEVIGWLCRDCVPQVHASQWKTADAGDIVVLSVWHDLSCPDFAAAIEVGTAPDGVKILHFPATGLIVRHQFESGEVSR